MRGLCVSPLTLQELFSAQLPSTFFVKGFHVALGSRSMRSSTPCLVGPTKQGVDDLIALDPKAWWDPNEKKVKDSCTDDNSCTTKGLTQSPRIVPVPVFDLDLYMQTGGPGKGSVLIVNILGFFVDKMQGNDVEGYLMTMPDLLVSNGGGVAQNGSFIKAIRLVR